MDNFLLLELKDKLITVYHFIVIVALHFEIFNKNVSTKKKKLLSNLLLFSIDNFKSIQKLLILIESFKAEREFNMLIPYIFSMYFIDIVSQSDIYQYIPVFHVGSSNIFLFI